MPSEEWGLGQLDVSPKVMHDKGYKEKTDALKEELKERRYTDGVTLPALAQKGWKLEEERQAVLLALYAEVCQGWRTLTDVRFKLLGLLPIVSVAVFITIMSKGTVGSSLTGPAQTIIALFGLIVTYAVWLYDQRNTELYNDLVGRGRQIEAELGIHTGHFRGRIIAEKPKQHDFAINIIYLSAGIGWFVVALAPLIDPLVPLRPQ
jgi:hypothetical protein